MRRSYAHEECSMMLKEFCLSLLMIELGIDGIDIWIIRALFSTA